MTDRLSRCFKQVVTAQAVLGLIVALLCVIFSGNVMALSVLFGTSIALVNTALSKRSVRKSSEMAYQNPAASMTPILLGWVQRLVLFCVSMVAGLQIFALLPLGFVGGFMVTQLGYLACKMK